MPSASLRAIVAPFGRTAPGHGDVAPLTRAQLAALGGAVGRELGWGLRAVSRRVELWRRRADRIADPAIRADALEALATKRSYADGAALFWILPEARDPRLLRLLVDFQITANFLDQVSERAAAERGASGGGLMRAFVDAVDLDVDPARDYYVDQPRNDGGYLAELVAACRDGCATLPGYRPAHDLLVREAARARVLELGHDPVPSRRDAALRSFAAEDLGSSSEASWFEQVAGAASAMTVIVLLARAAEPAWGRASRHRAPVGDAWADGGMPPNAERDLGATIDAYRWVASLSTMLDSYVDRADDLASGDWSMVGYYPDGATAAARIVTVIDRSIRQVGSLRDGERHRVIVSAMVALFLSRDSARDRELWAGTAAMARAGGSLTRTLVPALRLWRIAHRQQAV